MKKIGVSGKTKIYGLLGFPVSHTFSPYMHNAAFEALGMDAMYVAFNVRPDQIKGAIQGIKGLEIGGVNLTIPHKEICIPFLDGLTHDAQAIKAVNTIVREKDGRLIGHNTDGRGFVKALQKMLHIDPARKRVFIFGAGGAGKAVATQLAIEGVGGIALTDVAVDQARRLATNLKKQFAGCQINVYPPFIKEDIERAIVDCDIFVNATPCGMKTHDPLIVSPKTLHKKLAVCDLIYNPAQTPLVREAVKRKLRVMNGFGMLLYQGALSFELWTGKQPPLEVMFNALQKQMKSKTKFMFSR